MIKDLARDFLSNKANSTFESAGRCGAVSGSVSEVEFQAFLVAINNKKYVNSFNDLKNDPSILSHVDSPKAIQFIDRVYKFNEYKIKQERILLVTEDAIMNIKSKKLLRREIKIENL